ncbi:MAG: HDOD domain-containing protein [Gammaproteobacteria bacterium]|nr:HDOD domain-containing protein [Gammaproteobacteria bacterium]
MLDLNDFVDKAGKLFTLPDLCLQLNHLVNDSASSVDEIARLVGIDPALTIRVLKLANSALYNHKVPVVTIPQAIQIIGTDELNNIAISTSAALIFKGVGAKKINLQDFWEHSVFSAILAKQIFKKVTGKSHGVMFVAGLIHNIGVLVVLERLPYFVVDLNQIIGDKRLPSEHERSTLGFSYAELGSEMVSRWNISPMLAQIIKYQCYPFNGSAFELETVILNVAIGIADNILEGTGSSNCEKYIDYQILNELEVSYQQLDSLIDQAMDVAPSITTILHG